LLGRFSPFNGDRLTLLLIVLFENYYSYECRKESRNGSKRHCNQKINSGHSIALIDGIIPPKKTQVINPCSCINSKLKYRKKGITEIPYTVKSILKNQFCSFSTMKSPYDLHNEII
jgi:hypothetical protein